MNENIYAQLAALLAEGTPATLQTVLRGDAGSVAEDMAQSVQPFALPAVTVLEKDGAIQISEPILPKSRLIILGGGHVGFSLYEFAVKCDFSVTVIDDRPDFAAEARFPLAERVICGEFAESIAGLKLTSRDYVAVLTRGHAYDGDCLRALLRQPEPAYLGVIGSRKRAKELLEVLAGEGYDRGRLQAIHTPIGLPIGALTPSEVAVSILAEIIQTKRGPDKDAGAGSDLDTAVVDALAGFTGPGAIATIISAQGHTPRKAGAKMVILPGGEIIGTIGGGLGEATAIQTALACLGTGRYQVLRVSMNRHASERNGMACGGSMSVLIEDISGNGVS